MSLDEFLREKIREYKMAHPRYSSAQIARFWGLSTSSLNRLENLETKKPSIEQAVKILNGIGIKDDLFDILNDFYPELTNLFLEISQKGVQNPASTTYLKSTCLDQEVIR